MLSYHTNVDDAYRTSSDWDEDIVVPHPVPDGGQDVQAYVCHTRDAEIGLLEELVCGPTPTMEWLRQRGRPGDHVRRHTRRDWGIGNGIHQDFTYLPVIRHAPGEERWRRQFFLEREMLAWDEVGDGLGVRYADDVIAEICIGAPDALRVTWGDVVVAEGDGRSLPRGAAATACGWTSRPACR